jgi:predicted outer membrane repeat protein
MTIQNGAIERDPSASSNFRFFYLNEASATLNLVDLFLSGGNAFFGATAYAVNGTLNIEGCVVSGSVSEYGAVRAFGADARVTISDSTFDGNSSSLVGAALALGNAAQAFVVNTTFTNNDTDGDGGAIHAAAGARLSLINVALQGNRASNGGAIYSAGNADLINVLIAGNLADNQGGGLYAIDDSGVGVDLELLNATISGNRAADVSGGGGIRMESGDADIDNTILWGNVSGTLGGAANDNVTLGSGATVGFDTSVLEGGIPFGSTNDDINFYTDPLFVGPVTPTETNTPNTAGNYRFYEGSPAIDAGEKFDFAGGRTIESIEHDLDRTTRIQNFDVDIGAYEGGEPLVFPDVVPSPDRVDFGEVAQGVASPAATVAVDNLGDGAVSISGLSIEGLASSGFEIVSGGDQCSGQTLAPSASCQFDVRFVPQDIGVREARVRIASDDPDGPAFVELVGTSGVLFYDGFEQ